MIFITPRITIIRSTKTITSIIIPEIRRSYSIQSRSSWLLNFLNLYGAELCIAIVSFDRPTLISS